MDSLKGKLRLSEVVDGDALAMIEEAVRTARIRFYDSLDAARVAVIVAINLEDAPTTDNGILRQKAAVCEAKIVRLELLRTLPHMAVEALPADEQAWNQEGFLRDSRPSEIEREVKRLEEEIGTFLNDLAGEEPAPSALNVTSLGPDRDVMPRPGESIIPGSQRLYDSNQPNEPAE